MENLQKAARALGRHFKIRIKMVDKIKDIDQAPFCSQVGINASNDVLYQKGSLIGYIIHELGHALFGGIKHNDDISEIDFLAWEWKVNCWLIEKGLTTQEEWNESMDNYVIDYKRADGKYFDTYGDLPNSNARLEYLTFLFDQLAEKYKQKIPISKTKTKRVKR